MYLDLFFAKHAVFTADEFAAYLHGHGRANPASRASLLRYHEAAGRVARLRRGLYAVVPVGEDAATAPVDPYLIAGRAAPDSVVAYHAALALHGKAYSVHRRFEYLTLTGGRGFDVRGDAFRPVRFPTALVAAGQSGVGVVDADRSGQAVRVTGLERTLVDVLDRPDLGGGWEEAWRSLEAVEFYDLDRVVEYALLLGNATTVAKVGFFLDRHRDELMVDDAHLARLRAHRPKEPHYLSRPDRSADGVRRPRHAARLLSAWNLVVPASLLDRSWEEA